MYFKRILNFNEWNNYPSLAKWIQFSLEQLTLAKNQKNE